MFDRRFRLLAVLLVGVLSAHCSTRDQHVRTDHATADAVQESFTEDGLLMLRFDSTGDGVADTVKFFQVLDEGGEIMTDLEGLYLRDLLEQEGGLVHSSRTRLLRTEMDLDGDGNPDLVRHYNRQAQLIREEADPTGRGTFATTTHFNQGIPARTEIDSSGDGNINMARHFQRGQLHFIEEDTTGDGVFDMWRFYRGSMLVRVGRDLTGNGEVDRWEVVQRTGALRIRDGEGREQESEGDAFIDDDEGREAPESDDVSEESSTTEGTPDAETPTESEDAPDAEDAPAAE